MNVSKLLKIIISLSEHHSAIYDKDDLRTDNYIFIRD